MERHAENTEVSGVAEPASTGGGRVGLRLRLARRAAARMAARSGRWAGRDAGIGATTAVPSTVRAVMGTSRLRELELGDAPDWSEARLANTTRMRRWWGEEDWAEASSEKAFLDHYLSWAVTKRKGHGFALALVGNGHLVGEAHVYLHHGGRVAELGLWMRPGGMPAREMGGLCGFLLDHLVFERGVARIDAPVAVGNTNPVTLLRLGGFVREGRLAGWRPLGCKMSDMDMYGQTAEMWVDAAREQARHVFDWPESPCVRAVLARKGAACRRP